jgi:NAD(P)-dependent dehydrogenase (short-subunit alcohol dehydrogenase family)
MKPDDDAFTYLITGTNRGIGLEFARQLSERGERVIATARKPEKAKELAKLDLRVEALDVADGESVASLARRLDEPIDVLIHNAAVGSAGPGIDGILPEDVERAFQVNALGPLRVTQALLPRLRAGQRKTIVAITSGLGSISGNQDGGWSAYRISKAALNQLVRTIAAELSGEKFICVAISPGWVRTDMGGSSAPLSPEESVRSMLRMIDRLQPSDNGRFLDRSGKDVPW